MPRDLNLNSKALSSKGRRASSVVPPSFARLLRARPLRAPARSSPVTGAPDRFYLTARGDRSSGSSGVFLGRVAFREAFTTSSLAGARIPAYCPRQRHCSRRYVLRPELSITHVRYQATRATTSVMLSRSEASPREAPRSQAQRSHHKERLRRGSFAPLRMTVGLVRPGSLNPPFPAARADRCSSRRPCPAAPPGTAGPPASFPPRSRTEYRCRWCPSAP